MLKVMLKRLFSFDTPGHRALTWGLVLMALALAAAPWLFPGSKALGVAAKALIFILLVASYDLLLGYTGIVSFAHTMFFGIGAYAAVLLSPSSDAASLAWLLPASVVCAALYALAVGALSLRTKGVYFIMVTLAFAQMAYYVVHDTPLGGVTDGIYLYVKPVLGPWLDLDGALPLYAFTWTCLAITFAGLALVLAAEREIPVVVLEPSPA